MQGPVWQVFRLVSGSVLHHQPRGRDSRGGGQNQQGQDPQQRHSPEPRELQKHHRRLHFSENS